MIAEPESSLASPAIPPAKVTPTRTEHMMKLPRIIPKMFLLSEWFVPKILALQFVGNRFGILSSRILRGRYRRPTKNQTLCNERVRRRRLLWSAQSLGSAEPHSWLASSSAHPRNDSNMDSFDKSV